VTRPVPIAAVTLVVVTVLVATVLVVAAAQERRRSTAPAAEVPPVAATPTPDQVRQVSRSTGIPRRALTAYVAAAQTVERDDPGCRIAWNTLAGIGASESSHGSFGGARLDEQGVARPLVIGVPLDGTGGNRAIDDTDGGRLDGDRRWDRAVGDGDGRRDPHDIDDAALAAARYLCDAGTDLGGSEGWSRAVLTYNNSGAYARKVARTAAEYAEYAEAT
jgi:membrane-bound lytic murein transglycosylase B